MSLVSLGPTYGIFALNGMVFGKDGMAAMKFELTDVYGRICNGDEQRRVAENRKIGIINKLLGCANCFCYCCPCSIRYTPTVKRINRDKHE